MELKDRIKYAKRALTGTALGDCFGQSFFIPDETARQRIKNREIMDGPWHFTDDTVMAIGIYSILEKYEKLIRMNWPGFLRRIMHGTGTGDMEERRILFYEVSEKDRTGGKSLPARLMEWVPWGMAAQCVLRL